MMSTLVSRFVRVLLMGLIVAAWSGCASAPEKSSKFMDLFTSQGVDPATVQKIKNGRVLNLGDIEECVIKKVSSKAIISYLKSTQKPYGLTEGEVDSLKKVGADDDLIKYLLSSKELYGGKPYENHPYYNDPAYMGAPPFGWIDPGYYYGPMY